MNDKYQRLIKNSGIFMIANFGSKFFSFILVPFQKRSMKQKKYLQMLRP